MASVGDRSAGVGRVKRGLMDNRVITEAITQMNYRCACSVCLCTT